MALQFMIGGSGTGKSHTAYEMMIREAERRPDVLFYIIVPEQFTMQAQKTVVSMSCGGGILNIDVVSMTRLAYRVFEETGGDTLKMLDDIGKSMVLRRLVQGREKEYPYLGNQMKKPGCLDEVKSLISEFMQYDITPEEALGMAERAGKDSLLSLKLGDVGKLYGAFREYLKDRYMTSEGVMEELAKAIPLSKRLKGCVVLLDGFTGFTPVQQRVLRELLSICRDMTVTVTMNAEEKLQPLYKEKLQPLYKDGDGARARRSEWSLFSMSNKMIRRLSEFTNDIREPILLRHSDKSRFCHAPALAFLEKNLFRYTGEEYEGDPGNIEVMCAGNPGSEMEEAARRICRMVRTKEIRYGEIAVITGNLEEYGPAAQQAFEKAGIPYFIDETHSILENPFVEYLRASLELVDSDFSYESVFRYLRCGLSEIGREEADLLENYVRAVGIRGFSAWKEKWIRLYRGMDPVEMTALNEIRERFLGEIKELKEGFLSNGSVKDYCTMLYSFLRKNNIEEKLQRQQEYFAGAGEKVLEKEYDQIYGIVMELFDRMVSILGEERMTRREFGKVLETGLSKAKVALIPPGQDQVLVGDMERTRLKDVRVLFFAGVNEGNIPKAASSGGILSDTDREYLADEGIELAPDPREQMNVQRFYLYLNLTKPGEKLILSCSRSSLKGEALRPAYLIGNLKSLFPGLNVQEILPADSGAPDHILPGKSETESRILSADSGAPDRILPGKSETESRILPADSGILDRILPEKPELGLETIIAGMPKEENAAADPFFDELYRWYLRNDAWKGMVRKITEAAFTRAPAGSIGRAVAKALYKEVPGNGATRLERYAACACAHFMRYGLRLMERQEYELRAVDLGNLVHEVLEAFDKEMREEGLSYRSLTENERNRLLDHCLDTIASDYGHTILKSSSRNTWMIERARRILRRTVWALQQQVLSGRFEPEGVEIAFGGGRIDRLDVLEEKDRVFVKVIDYKTGNTSFELLKLYHGLQIQLVLYLDAALQIEKKRHPGKEVIPAGIFYYNVKDPVLEGDMDLMPEEIEKQLLRKLRMNGLSSEDREIILAMDREGVSLPVRLSSGTGALDQKTKAHAVSREQFEIMTEYVRNMTEKNRLEILGGDTRANPFRMKQGTPCSSCAYKTACGFENGIPGYFYREIRKLGNDKLWQQMEDQVKAKGDGPVKKEETMEGGEI